MFLNYINYTKVEIIMKKRIFVTATNTDIGKTHTTKLLLKEFASRGVRVGVIKPIETGVDNMPLDGIELLKLLKELNSECKNLDINDIVPITYKLPAAPFIASGGENIDFSKIDKAVLKLEELCDILIVEGAGGLLVPIDKEKMMIDLIEYFDASALLVTHCSLGCINDTLLSKKLLQDRNIEHTVVFNCKKDNDSFEIVSEPYFLQTNQKVLKVSRDIETICDIIFKKQEKQNNEAFNPNR